MVDSNLHGSMRRCLTPRSHSPRTNNTLLNWDLTRFQNFFNKFQDLAQPGPWRGWSRWCWIIIMIAITIHIIIIIYSYAGHTIHMQVRLESGSSNIKWACVAPGGANQYEHGCFCCGDLFGAATSSTCRPVWSSAHQISNGLVWRWAAPTTVNMVAFCCGDLFGAATSSTFGSFRNSAHQISIGLVWRRAAPTTMTIDVFFVVATFLARPHHPHAGRLGTRLINSKMSLCGAGRRQPI